MSFRSVLYLTLCGIAASAGEQFASAQEKELRTRLGSEAPAKWEAYREFSKRLQGSYLEEMFDRTADNKRIGHTRIQQKSTDYAKLLMFDVTAPEDRHHCWVRNEQYAFELRRKKDSEPWVLAQLHLDDKKAGKSPIHKYLGGERYVSGPFMLFEHWLPDFIKRPSLRLTSIEIIPQENSNLIRVAFAYAQSDKEKKDGGVYVQDGWFILDPENYWLIREYEVKALWPSREKGTVHGHTEWRTNKDGFPILTKQTKLIQAVDPTGPKTEVETRIEYKYEEREPGPEEFTLSAFGLPEPKGIVWDHGGTLWWLWITLAAVGTLVSALLFLRLKRHYQISEPVNQ